MTEGQHAEWKTSWRDEYLKWLCGFANAQGGILEIGRNDRGQVVGVENAARLLEELPNKLRDLLGIVADIDLLEQDGKPYLRIEVEPYPVPISYRGEYHYRSGSTKQVLKGAALDRFLLGKTGRRWDAVPVPGVAVADLDVGALARFRDRAVRSQRLAAAALGEDDAGLIEKLRLTEGDYLKRAAVLLFHPDPERFFTGASIKIGYFASESDLRYHDEIAGDLFTQVDRTMELLLSKYLKATISYEGIQRIESYPMPESALREAVLNAVVHRDYAVAAPIQIRVYADHLRIWNPGELPEGWSEERLLGPHSSQPFNPDARTGIPGGLPKKLPKKLPKNGFSPCCARSPRSRGEPWRSRSGSRPTGSSTTSTAFGTPVGFATSARQRRADGRSWGKAMTSVGERVVLTRERVAAFFLDSRRVEPVGLVYLWPESN